MVPKSSTQRTQWCPTKMSNERCGRNVVVGHTLLHMLLYSAMLATGLFFFHGFVPFPRCGSASGRQTLYHTILYVYDDSSIKLKTSFLAFFKNCAGSHMAMIEIIIIFTLPHATRHRPRLVPTRHCSHTTLDRVVVTVFGWTIITIVRP